MLEDLGYGHFQKKVLSLTGIDLRSYKSEQMIRRLGTLMNRCNVSNFVELGQAVENNPKVLNQFLDYFTINVSEFFRDPTRFTELQKSVLPALLRQRPRLRIWSAGCSIGAEPYTLAIILAELSPLTRHYILATDVDATTLRKAINANSYNANDIKNVNPLLVSKYFIQNDNQFALTAAIKSRVEFRQHDLLTEPEWRDFDLILCRNVVIYFTEDVKERIFASLSNALRPGGVLFIGGTETIRIAKDVGLEPIMYSFYRRAA